MKCAVDEGRRAVAVDFDLLADAILQVLRFTYHMIHIHRSQSFLLVPNTSELISII